MQGYIYCSLSGRLSRRVVALEARSSDSRSAESRRCGWPGSRERGAVEGRPREASRPAASCGRAQPGGAGLGCSDAARSGGSRTPHQPPAEDRRSGKTKPHTAAEAGGVARTVGLSLRGGLLGWAGVGARGWVGGQR